MKTQLEKIRSGKTPSEKLQMINKLALIISKTDKKFLRIGREMVDSENWKSICIANSYYFGGELADALISRLSNKITNIENFDFDISDYIEDIEGAIFRVL